MSCWRYLEDDGATAASGLAVDEAIMGSHGDLAGGRPHAATLRLYTYAPHCVLVGRYQSLEDEADLGACAREDVQVGRRPTGGGAIIMGPSQLGVAFVTAQRPGESGREALQRFAAGVIAGLSAFDIDARFRCKNDLEVGGRKIAGLGLYADGRGAVLFHASVLVDLDIELMLRVLSIPGAKLSDKAVARVQERVTTVSRELGTSLSASSIRGPFAARFASAFSSALGADELTAAERAHRDALVREKYGNRAWIFQPSQRRDGLGAAVLKTPAGLLRIHVGVNGDAVKSVLVRGDFNELPPAIARLEAALKWCRAGRERIGEITRAALTEDDLGIAPDKVAAALWEATAKALQLPSAAHPRRSGSCYFPEPDAAARSKEN